MSTINTNLASQIVVQTAAQWLVDATIYSEKRLLVTSDLLYTGTNFRKFKLANGTDTHNDLDYFADPNSLINSITLADLLNNGNTTGEQPIISNDGYSVLNLLDGNAILKYDNGSVVNQVLLSAIQSLLDFTDGTNNGGVEANATAAILYHNLLAVLNAPVINLPYATPSRLLATDSLSNIDTPYAVDTDGLLAANSDTRIATQKAVKSYADALLSLNDALVFKGVINASTNPNYPAADKGHTYKISVAGKIGGASGINVEIGDTIYCIVDGSPAGTQAAVGANWVIVQTNIDGAVIGPTSSTDGAIPLFDGVTGKLIKNSTLVPTSLGTAFVNFANPGAITFVRINADNSVSARSAAQLLSDIGAITAASTDTLENKSISLASNTLSGTKAQFNTAVSDGNISFKGDLDIIQIADATGPVNAITATFSPAITLADKQRCHIISTGKNTSTTPTFSPDGLTAHAITKQGGRPLISGDIGDAGCVVLLEYNMANTRWELSNPQAVGSSRSFNNFTSNSTQSTSNVQLSSVKIPANTFTTGNIVAASAIFSKTLVGTTAIPRLGINTSDSISGVTALGVYTILTANSYAFLTRTRSIRSATEFVGVDPAYNNPNDVGSAAATITIINVDWTVDQWIMTYGLVTSALTTLTCEHLYVIGNRSET